MKKRSLRRFCGFFMFLPVLFFYSLSAQNINAFSILPQDPASVPNGFQMLPNCDTDPNCMDDPAFWNNYLYWWDFGDGELGFSPIPVKQYPFAGSYNVSLKSHGIYDNDGEEEESPDSPDFIEVGSQTVIVNADTLQTAIQTPFLEWELVNDPKPGYRMYLAVHIVNPDTTPRNLEVNVRTEAGLEYDAKAGEELFSPVIASKIDRFEGLGNRGNCKLRVPAGAKFTVVFPFRVSSELEAEEEKWIKLNLIEDNFSHQKLIGTVLTKRSWDPNHISVFPSGCLEPNVAHELTYTLHFENIGPGEASLVTLFDTLDAALLDLSTVTTHTSSHDFRMEKHSFGLKFISEFQNQGLLAPSGEVNAADCQGMIRFKIMTVPLPEGTEIESKLGIKFDNNSIISPAPAIAKVEVCEDSGCDQLDCENLPFDNCQQIFYAFLFLLILLVILFLIIVFLIRKLQSHN